MARLLRPRVPGNGESFNPAEKGAPGGSVGPGGSAQKRSHMLHPWGHTGDVIVAAALKNRRSPGFFQNM